MDSFDLRGRPDSISSCCGAQVTSQGLCGDCGEHAEDVSQDGPTDAQQERAQAGAEAADIRYRQNLKSAGRGHLLPP